MIITCTGASDDWSGGRVQKCLDGSNFSCYFEEVLVAIDVDFKGCGNKRVVDVCVGGRCIDYDVRPNLFQDEADLLDVGYVSNMVRHAFEVVLRGTSRHDCHRGAGWLFEEEFDYMVSKEATSTNDEDSAKMGAYEVMCVESSGTGDALRATISSMRVIGTC